MTAIKLKCGCSLEEHLAVPSTGLETLPARLLRQYANAHNILPSGASGSGGSRWRNGANHTELKKALEAHLAGQPLALPTEGPGVPGIEHLPNLLDEMEGVLKVISPEVIQQTIEQTVDRTVEKYRTTLQQIQITLSDDINIILESQHKDFKNLLRVMAAGVNVMMVGPAGSGKTEAAMAAAKALQKDFELISVGPQTMQSELAGYKNAHGDYVTSAVRRAYSEGKVLIIDEIDAGNAGVFTFTNATLSNSAAGYPDGPAIRHPKFQVIACANTFGTGADMVYIGRAQLDGATLDRYAALVWDYDHDFELHLALQHNPNARQWVEQVQQWRKNMMKHKIRHIISPRASIFGAKLMKVGFTPSECASMLVFKGLNKELVDKIKQEQL